MLFVSLVFYFALKGNIEKKYNLKEKPTISIIIPILNEVNTVKGTIDSLLEAKKRYKNLKEIIVVDDGSTDGTYKLLQNLKEKINILKVYRNVVKSKGLNVNFGAKYATSEVIGVIDADTFVEPNIFNKMIPYFQNKKVGSVIATVVPKNLNNFTTRYQEIEYIFVAFVRRALSALDAMYITPGGGMPLYKRKLFNKLGGYCGPEILTEDMEIGVRLIKEGYIIKVSPDARSYTRVPERFYKFMRQRVRWYRGTIQTFKKHPDIVFTKSYGVVSLFVLPLFYLLIFATMLIYISISLGLVHQLWIFINKLKTLIRLNYFPHLFQFRIETNPLFMFSYIFIFVTISIIVWILTFKIGLKYSGKKMKINLFLLLFVSSVYGPITFSFYLIAFYEEFRKKKNRWW